jgi:predicted PurR-regulated permease PerM
MPALRTLENIAFFIVLFGVTVAFYAVVRDYLLTVFWAAIFAVLAFPLNLRLRRWLGGRPNLAALLTLAVIVPAVIVPLLVLGGGMGREAVTLYANVRSGAIDPSAPLQWLQEQVPTFSERLETLGVDLDDVRRQLGSVAATASGWLAGFALAVGQNFMKLIALATLMLYVLFFFLRDGEALIGHLVRVLPLGDEREQRFFRRFAEVARATVKGTFIVGALQGFLGGILFWALGLPGPVLWGMVMGVLSMLPLVGAVVVWGPVAIYFGVEGDWFRCLALVIVGGGVIGSVDNFLRPVLVGRDTRMPDYLILLSSLGGIGLLGLSGFIIGPMIAALFLTSWEIFEEDFGGRNVLARANAAEGGADGARAPSEDPAFAGEADRADGEREGP